MVITFLFSNGRYSTELLEKVKEMAEGIVVEDAPVFKTRDEIIKKQQVRFYTVTLQHIHRSSKVWNHLERLILSYKRENNQKVWDLVT